MIDTSSLYKLPWTNDSNPNGWIEPTTYCQLKCPLCYRGVDLEGFKPSHTDVDVVKREIDDLIKLRGVRTITIAGGEPLMFPHLDEIIDYIRARNVDVMIVTNGGLVNERMLRRLKKRDVARVVIHIDKFQGRKGIKTEEDANRMRLELCELFRKVGGVSLGFALPIGLENLDDLEVLIPFFKENADVIDLVNLNRLEASMTGRSLDSERLDETALFERVSKLYGLDYCAYLGKTQSGEISWLFAQAVFSGTELIGSLDKQAFRFFHENNYRGQSGTRATAGANMTSRLMLYAPFNQSLRKMAFRFLGLNGKRGKIGLQLILLINTPKKKNGEWDTCKGCPDAMMYEGRLIPSCLLERVKCGEDILAG